MQVRIDVAGDPAGAALLSQAGEPVATGATAVHAVSTMLRVDLLPPGSYVARATVTRGGEELGRLSRPFQIMRAPAQLVGFGWRPASGAAGEDIRRTGHPGDASEDAVRPGAATRCEPGR